jgi:hypothetical protein
MSKSIHFIVQADPSQLGRVWPDNARYINEHTDPQYFIHLRYSNIKEADGWRHVCDALGYDFDGEDFAFNTSSESSADLGEYAIFCVPEDEADEWITQAEAYLSPLDLTDDET